MELGAKLLSLWYSQPRTIVELVELGGASRTSGTGGTCQSGGTSGTGVTSGTGDTSGLVEPKSIYLWS